MSGLPVVLELGERPCLVVGAGRAARWKIDALLAAGATVTVIAPDASGLPPEVATVHRRAAEGGDTDGFALVVVATNVGEVNDAVAAEARRHGALVLRADGGGPGDLRLPAVHRSGQLSIAVDSGGSSPTLARWARDRLADLVPAHWAELASWAAVTRPLTTAEVDRYVAESGS